MLHFAMQALLSSCVLAPVNWWCMYFEAAQPIMSQNLVLQNLVLLLHLAMPVELVACYSLIRLTCISCAFRLSFIGSHVQALMQLRNAGRGRVTCQLGRRAFCQACPAENRQCRQDGQCLPPKPCQPSQHVAPVSVPGPAYSIPIRRLECVHQTTVSTPMSRPTVMSSKSAHHC